jgi:hypothetical protein
MHERNAMPLRRVCDAALINTTIAARKNIPPRNTPEPEPHPITNPYGSLQHMHERNAKRNAMGYAECGDQVPKL